MCVLIIINSTYMVLALKMMGACAECYYILVQTSKMMWVFALHTLKAKNKSLEFH